MRFPDYLLFSFLFLYCGSLSCTPAGVQNNNPYPPTEKVYLMPIGERSPIAFGIFDDKGEFLYSLPHGSQPFNIRSVAPLNPAVLNRLVMLPDSSMAWAAKDGLQPIEGLDGSQIMRVARCIDSRYNLANYLYWDPNDAFCTCYRMQDNNIKKYYFSPQGQLVNPGPFSPKSGPMQEGYALVKAFDSERDEYGRSKDRKPWQLLNSEGELSDIELDIFEPVSAFHQGRALVLVNTQAAPGQNLQLAVINTQAEVLHTVDIPAITSFGVRLLAVDARHGYFLLKKSQQSENNNFLILDVEGQEVARYEGFSDLHILGTDRILLREQGPGRNQGARVRLENLNGDLIQSWENVHQIIPASGLDDSRLLAIGESPNAQIWQIDSNGERLHRLMGNEAYQLGEDHFLVMRRERRQRSISWQTTDGTTYYDSRWMEQEQSWPLPEAVPIWAINNLNVEGEPASVFAQMPQMPGLYELHLPGLDPELSIDLAGPLPRLRKLRVNRASAVQLQQLIEQMPALTELTVSYLTDIDEDIQLPVLEQVRQVRLIVKGAPPIYDWLTSLPSLYRLDISSDDPAFLQEVESWRDSHRWNIRTHRVYFDGAESDGAIMQEDEPEMMEEAVPDRG